MLILRLGRGEFQSDNFPSLLDAGRPIWLCPFGRVLWWEPRDSCKALLLGFRAGDSFRFSLGQKTPGIAQVRYLKQNSRRKDAVSEMTLETRETLEVNINFATLQCFFVQEWLAIDYKLYNHFLQVFEGEILRWEKEWASILQLWEGSSCKRRGPAATDEQAAWKRMCSCQYQQFRAE